MERTNRKTIATSIMLAVIVLAIAFMALFALSPAITAKATPTVYEGGATLDLDILQVGDVISGVYGTVTGKTITNIRFSAGRYSCGAQPITTLPSDWGPINTGEAETSLVNNDGMVCFHSNYSFDFYPVTENGELGTAWVVTEIKDGAVYFGGQGSGGQNNNEQQGGSGILYIAGVDVTPTDDPLSGSKHVGTDTPGVVSGGVDVFFDSSNNAYIINMNNFVYEGEGYEGSAIYFCGNSACNKLLIIPFGTNRFTNPSHYDRGVIRIATPGATVTIKSMYGYGGGEIILSGNSCGIQTSGGTSVINQDVWLEIEADNFALSMQTDDTLQLLADAKGIFNGGTSVISGGSLIMEESARVWTAPQEPNGTLEADTYSASALSSYVKLWTGVVGDSLENNYGIGSTFTVGETYYFNRVIYFYDEIGEYPSAEICGERLFKAVEVNKWTNESISFHFARTDETGTATPNFQWDPCIDVPNSFVIISGSGTYADPFHISYEGRSDYQSGGQGQGGQNVPEGAELWVAGVDILAAGTVSTETAGVSNGTATARYDEESYVFILTLDNFVYNGDGRNGSVIYFKGADNDGCNRLLIRVLGENSFYSSSHFAAGMITLATPHAQLFIDGAIGNGAGSLSLGGNYFGILTAGANTSISVYEVTLLIESDVYAINMTGTTEPTDFLEVTADSTITFSGGTRAVFGGRFDIYGGQAWDNPQHDPVDLESKTYEAGELSSYVKIAATRTQSGQSGEETLTFGKVTAIEEITEENIGECSFDQAKTWIFDNWDVVFAGADQDQSFIFAFSTESGLRSIAFALNQVHSDKEFFMENYDYPEPAEIAYLTEYFENNIVVYLCGFNGGSGSGQGQGGQGQGSGEQQTPRNTLMLYNTFSIGETVLIPTPTYIVMIPSGEGVLIDAGEYLVPTPIYDSDNNRYIFERIFTSGGVYHDLSVNYYGTDYAAGICCDEGEGTEGSPYYMALLYSETEPQPQGGQGQGGGDTPHTHNDITFTAWTETDYLPTEAGDYYLTADVTLTSTWEVPSGTTNICLNGFGIKWTGETSYSGMFYVGRDVVLNLYDCGETLHYYDLDDDQILAINIDETEGVGRGSFTGGYITGGRRGYGAGGTAWVEYGTFNMYGGTMIGNTAKQGGAVYVSESGGAFNMYGGTITHNEATGGNGGAVLINYSAAFNMYGGSVTANMASGSGGAVQLGSTCTFNMYGGSITANRAGDSGGGVYKNTNYSVIGISGKAVITDNISNNVTNNIYVSADGDTLRILDTLTDGAAIGITLGTYGKAFTSGWKTNMNSADPANYFFSDDESYAVYLKGDEAAILEEAPPAPVSLGEGVLYVGGVDIVKANNYTVSGTGGGKAVLSETDGKLFLTLTDYVYEGPGYSDGFEGGAIDFRCGYENGRDLIIVLVGNNTITKADDGGIECSHGIYFNSYQKSLIVQGTGTLTIGFAGDRTDTFKSNGIFCEPGSFVMNGGTVVSNGGRNCEESLGIYSNQSIIFNGGSFTGNGYNTYDWHSYGIYCYEIIVNGGTVYASSPIDNGEDDSCAFNGTVTINGGTVTAYGKEAFYESNYYLRRGEQSTWTILAGDDEASATEVSGLNGDEKYVHIVAETNSQGGEPVTEYDLYIAGVRVTSEALSGEGWSYDPDTNTLTLDNFTYEGEGSDDSKFWHFNSVVTYAGDDPFTVILVGDSGITNTKTDYENIMAFLSTADLSIGGSGSLTLSVPGTATNMSMGLCVDGDLTLDDGTITAIGGASEWRSAGICVLGKRYIQEGGSVFVRGGNAEESYGLYALGVEQVASIGDDVGSGEEYSDGITIGVGIKRFVAIGETSAIYTRAAIDFRRAATAWTDTAQTANGTLVAAGEYDCEALGTYKYLDMRDEPFKALDPDATIEIEVPEDKGEPENGDVLTVDTDAVPVEIAWYYDDDGDGLPDDPDHPIGTGSEYEVKTPEDSGHHIIAKVTQPLDDKGDPYPEGEVPTVYTAPVKVAQDPRWIIKMRAKSSVPSAYSEYIEEDEAIVRVYDVTLYRVDIKDGVEQDPVLAQPSAIKQDGTGTITLKLTIPDRLVNKTFRLLHVHAADEYAFVEYETSEDGKYVLIRDVDKLSDFAFVAKKADLIPTEQTDPTDPTEQTDPTDPTEPTDPTQPADPTEQGNKTIEVEPEITKEDDPTKDNLPLIPQGGQGGEEGQGGQGEEGQSGQGGKDEPAKPAVTIALEDTDPEDAAGVTVEVEVKTEVSEEVTKSENNVLVGALQNDDEITIVYEVKLIRTTIENGIEIKEEIQPSDIKPGTIVVINMAIPEELRGKPFKLLHIHADDDIKEVTSYSISEDGATLTVRVDRLSEFAFVGKKTLGGKVKEPNKIPDGAIAGIVIGGSFGVLFIGLLIYFLLKRDKKEDKKDVKKESKKRAAVVSTETVKKTEAAVIVAAPVLDGAQKLGFYRITKGEGGKCTFVLFYAEGDNLSKEMGVFDSEKAAYAAIKMLREKAAGAKAENRVGKDAVEIIPTPKFVLDVDTKGVYRYSFLDETGAILLQSVSYLNEKRCLEDLKKALNAVGTEEVALENGELKEDVIDAVEETVEESPVEDVVEEVAADVAEAEIEEEVSTEEEDVKEAPNASVSLKENITIARETVSHSAVNKQYVADYLKAKYESGVRLNQRGNETKTGLPLADTHYAIGEGKNLCFVYVYEVEGTTMLLVKVGDEYGKALAEKNSLVKRSAFPKSKLPWYSVIVDDSFAPEEIEKILDDAYLMNGGKPAADEGLSLKESLTMAKTTTVTIHRSKKGIADYLAEKYGDKAELNLRVNQTKTGLPLADTHYAIKEDGKTCFVYVYETNGVVVLLLRLTEEYALTVQESGHKIIRSAFPKSKYAWFTVILDDTYAEDDIKTLLDVAYDQAK